MASVLTAVAIMTSLGLFFAVVLAVANHFLKVEEDPRVEAVIEMLPGSNCGACGEPGCAAFGESLVLAGAAPGQCTVADENALVQIARFLGVEVGGGDKLVARLACAGREGDVRTLARYLGTRSCHSAFVVDGGGRACTWGCLGLSDCERACAFDAIAMNHHGLPVVDVDGCTACGDCVDICPLDLFSLVPLSHRLLVQCSSPLTGEDAVSRCSVACDACGRCAADSPPAVIEMVGGLPVISWDAEEAPEPRATWRCPTGAIVWLEDAQFANEAPLPRAGGTHA